MFKKILTTHFDQLPNNAEIISKESQKLPIQVTDDLGKVQFYIVSPEHFDCIDHSMKNYNPNLPENKEQKTQNNNALTEKTRVEFYGIVYSPSLKIMALTGKRTYISYTESELCNDYPNWNQANGENASFQALAKATDRKALMFIDETEDMVSQHVIDFLNQGYTTPSQLKPFIKCRL